MSTRRATAVLPPAERGSARVDCGRSRTQLSRVLLFFVFTYVITWTCFLLAGRLGAGSSGAALPLLLVGSFAPSAVAVVMTWRLDGPGAMRTLLRRLLQWRVKLRWYVFALGYLAVLKLLAATIQRLTVGTWPPVDGGSWYAVAIAIVVAGLVGGPLGEEIGWRGYALPRLAERCGPAAASVVLGVAWACWHLPLFFVAGLGDYIDQFGQSFPTYLLQVTALSVAIAYLMGNVGGSLVLAVLMHSAINQTKDIVSSKVPGAHHMWALSSSTVGWITVALLWICAGYFLFRMSRRNLHEPVPGAARSLRPGTR